MVSVIRDGKENRTLTHDNHKCIGCGICVETCPTESIKLGPVLPVARGLLEMDLISIQEKRCALCGLCSFACPISALNFEINGKNSKELEEYPKWEHGSEITEENCIYCGNCKKACPSESIYISRNLPKIEYLVLGEAEINKDKCIYCSMCKDICPANAITMTENNINSVNPYIAENIEIDKSKCIYCGMCKKICPEEAIKIVCTTCMDNEKIQKVEITGNIALDQNTCIYCGWCQEICPKDAAHVVKPFEGEILVNTEIECKGNSCHACQDVCQCNSISIVDNHSKINPAMCILCGACAKVCPQNILTIKRNDMKIKNINSVSWQKILGSLIE
jgi:4Fe-4S ferredoxin